MGTAQVKTKKKAAQLKQPKIQNDDIKRISLYDDDVVDAANLAIAIQKEDLTTNIELFVHCENLPKMDAFSLTDPMVVAYYDKEDKWLRIDRTEFIPETLNPKFVKTFIVSYNFERKQKLRFEVYDVDDFDSIDDLEKQEFIGFVECEIHDIMCAPTQSISRTIINRKSNRKRNGLLHVRGAEYDMGGNKILFQLACQSFGTRADVMLRMSYFTDNKDWMPIYATEPIKNQRKSLVEWADFYLPLSKFGNNDQAHIKLEIEEFNKTKGTQQIGECEISLQGMMENSGKFLRMNKNGLVVGQLKLVQVKQHNRYSFLSYIYSGAKIQLIMALDFTNSNKPPKSDESLHRYKGENEYVNAISSILGVLQYYNNDNRIPMYGFGAKLPPYYNIVSHCFACTGNIFDPFVYGGIDELLAVYRETVRAVTLHGPTVFSQVIEQAIKFAQSEKVDQQNQKYYILIILTDGSINDMQATIDQLYKAQQLPLSIVIVGIGNEDFTNMRMLDCDENTLHLNEPRKPLYSKTYQDHVKRDIVQFVDYKQCADNQEKLAKEILAEIPHQFLEYMEMNKIYPAKGKKNSKAITNEYIHQKIDEIRKLKKREIGLSGKMPQFLKAQRQEFVNQLTILGYNVQVITNIVNDGIPAADVNLVIELISEYNQKNPIQQQSNTIKKPSNRSDIPQQIIDSMGGDCKVNQRVFCIKQKNKFDELLQLKKQESQLITSNFLYNLHNSSPDPKPKPKLRADKHRAFDFNLGNQNNDIMEQQQQNVNDNMCLGCQVNKIQLVFMPCGHACSCMDCYAQTQHCLSCKHKVTMFAQIDYK